MTPALLFLLLPLVVAFPPGAPQIEESLDVSEIIARANADISTPLEHGDIVQTRQRNADPCVASGCKWPKRRRYVYVPVSIAKDYTRRERIFIIRSLVTFHRSTCIRFRWRRNWHKNYLHFFSGTGCWSYLGRQIGGQMVSLKKNGCLYTSTVQHEVLHALGFHHEHVRSDRDTYVSILTANIQPGKESNFAKRPTNNLGTAYDFKSVMHYSKFAFSNNGEPTIIAKSDPDLNFGFARTMSANDIARINELYQCCETLAKDGTTPTPDTWTSCLS